MRSAQNCKKCNFFDNLRIMHTLEVNMEATQITTFFNLLFLLYLFVIFISKSENVQDLFSNSFLWLSLVFKIPQSFAKSYLFGQLITRFQKVETLRLLKIYIMFCPPAGVKYPFLGSSSWNVLGIEENFMQSLPAFFMLFLVTKKSF